MPTLSYLLLIPLLLQVLSIVILSFLYMGITVGTGYKQGCSVGGAGGSGGPPRQILRGAAVPQDKFFGERRSPKTNSSGSGGPRRLILRGAAVPED